jgi:integrase/recombinase XerD
MGNFFCRRDADGHERWWLEVRGKGDKEGLVPASAEMMVELGRYRRERGLSALPSRHEDTPLVLPLGKSMKPLTRAALHTIVKGILSRCRRANAVAQRRFRGTGRSARSRLSTLVVPHRRLPHGRWRRRSAYGARQPASCVADEHQPDW